MRTSQPISTAAPLCLLILGIVLAEGSLPPLTLQRTTDESGSPVSRLQWPAETGMLYRLQTATNLNAGNNENWNFGDALMADSTNAVLEIRGRSIPENSAEFFRLVAAPEIFDIQPAFADSDDTNSTFYILGQLLPTNATVFINGKPFATTNENGVLRLVSLNGLPPGQPIPGTIYVVDNTTGMTNSEYKLKAGFLFATDPGQEQLQGPPTTPPASPAGLLAAYLSKKGYDYYQAQSALNSAGAQNNPYFAENPLAGEMPQARFLSKRGYDYYQARSDLNAAGLQHNPAFQDHRIQGQMASRRTPEDCDDTDRGVFPATGEFRCAETDIALPGRGLDFAWTRTYRSRTGSDTAQGAGWDFSFNVSLTHNADGTLTLRPGNGRADTFYPDGTNGWIRDEYFVEIRDLDTDGYPDLLFADTGRWMFNAPGTPAAGKLARIVDRYGNTMTLNYDGAGRLAEIVDDLGRTNTVAYNPAGRVASVTDFDGRVVRYEYSPDGALVACVSPATSDFPGGITNRYTYTSGQPDPRLDHNLTSCIDGRGQTCLQISYSTNNNPASIEFDTVISTQRGIEKKDIRRGMVIAKPGNRYATVKVTTCDALGNVTESFHDSRQRCVRLLQYTGRSNPARPVTDTENRPTGKLRAADPDYFETQWAWNPDSLCTQEMRGDGSRTDIVHQRARDYNSSRSNKTASRRHEGNTLVVRERAPAGEGGDLDGDGVPDYTELVWRFEHDPRFGSPPSRAQDHNSSRSNKTASRSSVQDHNSSRSNKSSSALDGDDGDNTPIIKGSARKRFGIGHTAPGTPLGSARYGGINAQLPDTALHNARTRVNELEARLKALRLLASATPPRDKDKPFLMPVDDVCDGFVTRVTDPRGNVTTVGYDAKGNPTNSTRNTFQLGALAVEDSISSFAYNSHGQLTAVTNAADANGYRRVDTFSYYPSGPQAGQLSSIAIDEPGVRRISRFEYDPRGNLTRYVDPRTNDWLYAYDALDRCTTRTTPANSFGSRTATSFAYDANGNLVSSTTGLRDENNNFRHTVVWNAEYDLGNRCTAVIRQVSPGVFLTNRFDYDACGNLAACRSPLAVDGTDPHAVVEFQYDERGYRWRQTAGPLAPVQSTTEFAYDANGQPKSITVGIGVKAVGGTFTVPSRCFGQPASIIDPLGNVTTFNYDRAGNLTRVRCYGETEDGPGSAGNRLLADTRYTYDALDRCVRQTDSFFDVFTLAPIGDGAATTKYTYCPNGACTSVTDDNGHSSLFRYDSAGRLAGVSRGVLDGGPFEEGVQILAFTYDAAGNVVSVTETNRPGGGGAVLVFRSLRVFDHLGLPLEESDNVGNATRYAYDSLGRLTRETNPNGVTTAVEYDDLGRGLKLWVDTNGDRKMSAGELQGLRLFDANSRVLSETDANTNVTRYSYDSLGRRTGITRADGTVCSLIWSPRSNLLRVQDPNGTVIDNTYDLLDRCVRRDVTPGATTAATTTFETFAHDGLSRCVAASNDVSLVTFTYDSLGNCQASSQNDWQIGHSYDAVGNRLATTYPSGRVVTCAYNVLNEISAVSTRAKAGAPPSLVASFAYAGPGRLSGITNGNGVTTSLTWNGLVSPPNAPGDSGCGQVSGFTVTGVDGSSTLEGRAMQYDHNQNLVSRVQTAPVVPGGTILQNALGYDALDRLVNFARIAPTSNDLLRSYTLDANGNRVTAFSNGVPASYTMDAALPPGDFQMNQYTVTPFAMQLFDENGNLSAAGTAAGARQFVYDYADQLVAVNDAATGSPLASYAYDALGRRISKTIFPGGLPPVTTAFIRGDEQCDDGNIIEERENGALVRTHVAPHVFEQQGRVIFTGTGETFYLLADDLGNTLAVTDAGGNVVERCDYDDFGAPIFLAADGTPTLETSSAVGNPFLFRGLEWDAELGFYHFTSRNSGGDYFDPASGRATTGKVKSVKDMGNAGLIEGNPWSLKKEEGGRHTPFHNKYRPQYSAAKVPRNIVKEYFQTGDKPTQAHFGALIDSSLNFVDDRDALGLRLFGKSHELKGHVTLIK